MGIYERQLAEGKLLAMMPDHKRKVQKALADIEQMLAACRSPYVSLSWGKQSICLMHLVYRVDQTIPGVFWRGPETHLIADFDDVMLEFCVAYPINYHEENCEYDFKKQAWQWGLDNGKMGVFMGLVREESKARRYTLAKANVHNIYRYSDGLLRSTPLRLWGDMDIAAYAALHKLPMLSTYRKYGFGVRTSARIKIDGKSHTEKGMDYLTSEQQSQVIDSQWRRKDVTQPT